MSGRNKVIIGITGEPGAGKEEFWKAFCKVSRENSIYDYARYGTSVFLRKILEDRGIVATRDNLPALVVSLESADGEGAAMRMLLESVRAEKPTLRIIDSIRMPADETALRTESHNILLYVTAPPLMRLDRMRSRGEKAGEKDLTIEKFMEQELSHTEKHVPEIGSRADWKIENIGTVEELEEKVREFFAKIAKPKLEKPE